MRVTRKEWELIGAELVRRDICKPIPKDRLIWHNGKPLLNSVFGVGKNKFITKADGSQAEILRLIVNLIPSNEIQSAVPGDIETLPHFGQWSGLELLGDEVVMWSSEDINCMFYVFSLCDDWLPYFVLDWPLDPSLWGGPSGEPMHLALRVLPMGWKNAVGIAQANLRHLVQSSAPSGANVPSEFELRKDRALPTDHYHRCSHGTKSTLTTSMLVQSRRLTS